MSLDSYSGLKAELQTWLTRADQSSEIDTVIDLFESWANRNLRVRQMEQEATAAAAEYLPLPVDYLALRDIQWQGTPRIQLRYMTPQQADAYDPNGTLGTPRYYTVVGDQFRLIYAPDTSATNVRIAYWKRIQALDDANPSNWLLSEYPDAYLYGALTHARALIVDPQQAQFVGSIFSNIVTEIDRAGKSSNYGSLLQVRTA